MKSNAYYHTIPYYQTIITFLRGRRCQNKFLKKQSQANDGPSGHGAGRCYYIKSINNEI